MAENKTSRFSEEDLRGVARIRALPVRHCTLSILSAIHKTSRGGQQVAHPFANANTKLIYFADF